MIKKAGDVEAKANLQPPFYVREIDSKCSKGYRPLVKKDKEDANWEHHDEAFKDKDTAKSHTPSFTNQSPAQASKKRQKNQQGGLSTTEVNAIEVAKKDKDKVKDLSHVKCYTCKQKGHYANRCLEKPKN